MNTRGLENFRRAVPAPLCGRVRAQALLLAADTAQQSLWTRLTNLMGLDRAVRKPWNRSHVALPYGADVEASLRLAVRAAGAAGAFERAGVLPSARLVELSSMVAFPGAAEQDVHSDVPPNSSRKTCTLWLALQPVDWTMGPTGFYPASPDDTASSFHWDLLAGNVETTYGPDGEATSTAPYLEEEEAAGAGHPFRGVEPEHCVAESGDAFLMDCRTFHFGSANTSETPRAQLSATFRDVDGSADDATEGADGFTYLYHGSVPQLTLGELLQEPQYALQRGACEAERAAQKESQSLLVDAAVASSSSRAELQLVAPFDGGGPVECASRIARAAVATENECERAAASVETHVCMHALERMR